MATSLQRQTDRPTQAPSVPTSAREVVFSPGQPLDHAARSWMEPKFGHDFSGVRVHTNSQAAESANSVRARAYTFGNNIVFGTGQYFPAAAVGRQLLAHELAHVVQQDNALQGAGDRKVNDAQDASEREADAIAKNVHDGVQITVPRLAMPVSLARKEKDQDKGKAPDRGKESAKDKDKSSEKTSACVPPTSVTLGRTETLDLSSYMTGGGICAVMKVMPADTNLCPGITEEVTTAEGGTCPGSLLKPSLCSGSSTFPLGRASHGACSAVKPEANEFVDRHSVQLSATSVLHDESRNPRKLNGCAFTCKQRYFIDSGKTSTTLGNFLIRYSLAKAKRDGKDITEVTVSKKAAGAK